MQPGTRLGPYEILGPLGAGGMGEVYRARDTRLGREVAIKVLPRELTADTDRLRRFEQEARTVSSLNHPNIVTLHEIGSTTSGPYLVLEMVEGKSLRETLGSGPLPIRRVLAIGAQVAEGLAKAHAAGIVHRDLKPENVMLSADGFAKILDFGLARLGQPEDGAAKTDLPTVAARTGSGQILGTVGYMSPEQAAGQRVDPRSDQFALGALLYELTTGKSPFRRDTAAETMVAVMREEVPPLRDARPEAPAQLGWIVERCLAKDPEERYAATRDLARDLGDLRDRLSEVTRGEASLPRPRSWRAWRESAAWAVAVLALLAAALAFATGGTQHDGSGPSYRPLTFQRGVITGARFAPDGRTIYYSAAFGAEPSRLFVTHLDGSGSAPLDLPPAILHSVSSKGELAIVLTDARNTGEPGTLARVPALGGTPRPLAEDVLYADWAPDGENLAMATIGPTEFPIGHVLPVLDAAGFVRVAPAGDLLALVDDGLRVIDATGREVARQRMRLIYGLAWHPTGREVWFTASETGGGDRALWALSLDGELELLLRIPGALTLHDVGPDGNTALLSTGGGILGITGVTEGTERSFNLYGRTYLAGMTSDGRLLARETREVGFGTYLLSIDSGEQLLLGTDIALGISPDGKHVLVRNLDNPGQLALVPTGAGPVENLPVGELEAPFESRARWSADGRRLFAALRTRGDAETLRVYLLEPGGHWRPVTPAIAGLPFAVSPDGNHVAARGTDGVVSIHQVDGAPARLLEGERGYPLHWSDDGAWLFLRRGEGLPVAEVYRLEVASGRTEPWRTLGPADPTGVFRIGEVAIAGNGEAFAFGVQRGFHELFLVEDIR